MRFLHVHLPMVCLLCWLANPALAQESKIPLRYQSLVSSPNLKLVDVLGSPEMQPAWFSTSAITPDGNFALFASGGFNPNLEQTEDSVLSLWDVAKSRAVKEIPISRAAVSAMALSPDGKYTLTAQATVGAKGKHANRLVYWDIAAGKEIRSWPQPMNFILAVALSPTAKRALTGSDDGHLRLIDLDTGKELIKIKEAQNQRISHLLFTGDGQQAVTTWGQDIRLVNLNTAATVKTLSGHQTSVYKLSLSADGKRLASAALDQTVRVWDIEAGKSLAETKKGQLGTGALSLGLSPDGNRLIIVAPEFDPTGSREDCTVSLFDVQAKKETWSQPVPFKGMVPIAFPSNNEALIGGGANSWTEWNLDQGRLESSWGGHKAAVTAIGLDAGNLYSISQDGQSKIWVGGTLPKSFLGHKENATALAACPDMVLVGSSAKALLAWSDAKAKVRRIATNHTGAIGCLAIGLGCKRVASAGSDRIVKVWDLEAGKEVHSFTGHAEGINAVAISPDGRWAASASDDNTIRLWPLDKKSGDVDPIVLEGHKRQVTCLAYAPDGKHLVSGSQDQTLMLWDASKGKVVRTFPGHKNWINAVVFRGPGQLVSASDDLTVRLWDLTSAKELGKVDLGTSADCPKCLALGEDSLYVGTAGWVILKLQLAK